MAAMISDNDVPAGTCYIDHICVDGNYRGKGIGKVLMERADYEAKAKGCRVRLQTLYFSISINAFFVFSYIITYLSYFNETKKLEN